MDPSERAPLAKQIQQIAHEDQPYINIFNSKELWAFDSTWTSLSETDLLMLSTTNYHDSWKDLSHPSETNIAYAHPYELVYFSPFVIFSDSIARQYTNPIYPGLYERDPKDPNNAYAPVMAKSLPTWNDDKTIATIEIRQDMVFSDGETVTVDDIVNSFHMHMTPQWSVAHYSTLMAHIANYDSVVKINDTHLEITLIDPYFLATELFSVPILDMSEIGTPSATTSYGAIPAVGPKGDGVNGYDFNTDAYRFHGAGPFKYATDGIDAIAGNVMLERVADYWNGGDGTIETIQFLKYGSKELALSDLQDGLIHVIDSDFNLGIPDIEGKSGVAYKLVSDLETHFMSINMDHPIIGTGIDTPLGQSDPSRAEEAARYVRKAIASILPKERIINEILGQKGSLGTSLWPDVAAGYDNTITPFTYDEELAWSYMEMAGYSASASSQTTSDTSTTTRDPTTTTSDPTTTTSDPTITTSDQDTVDKTTDTPSVSLAIVPILLGIIPARILLHKKK
jgi:ABC-type transport system substrate-binding protein